MSGSKTENSPQKLLLNIISQPRGGSQASTQSRGQGQGIKEWLASLHPQHSVEAGCQDLGIGVRAKGYVGGWQPWGYSEGGGAISLESRKRLGVPEWQEVIASRTQIPHLTQWLSAVNVRQNQEKPSECQLWNKTWLPLQKARNVPEAAYETPLIWSQI